MNRTPTTNPCPFTSKPTKHMEWPPDKAFYLLSKDGLFLCRNHPFFSSCVPSDRWPGELAGQRPFIKFDYPRLPRRLIERVVGFFDVIGERYDSEAAVLLVWNRDSARKSRWSCLNKPERSGPPITADRYPLDLYYEIPPLPPHQMLIGDIHSHVDGPAYASGTDKADEAYRPGLHIVVGRIREEPPEFHCAVTADGVRFPVKDPGLVMEDYHRRRCGEVPEEWIARVKVEESSGWKPTTYYSSDRTGTDNEARRLGSRKQPPRSAIGQVRRGTR